MAFMKTGAPEKQKVVLAEEEVDEQANGEVELERELDNQQLPEDSKDEAEEEDA